MILLGNKTKEEAKEYTRIFDDKAYDMYNKMIIGSLFYSPFAKNLTFIVIKKISH